jgi:hypothetical protein
MANPHRGEVELKAGEKTYTLALQINEWAAIERRFKVSGGQLIGEVVAMLSNPKSFRFGAAIELLWGCLRRHHKDEFLNEDDVGNLINEIGLNATTAAIVAALNASKSEKDEKTSANPQ